MKTLFSCVVKHSLECVGPLWKVLIGGIFFFLFGSGCHGAVIARWGKFKLHWWRTVNNSALCIFSFLKYICCRLHTDEQNNSLHSCVFEFILSPGWLHWCRFRSIWMHQSCLRMLLLMIMAFEMQTHKCSSYRLRIVRTYLLLGPIQIGGIVSWTHLTTE